MWLRNTLVLTDLYNFLANRALNLMAGLAVVRDRLWLRRITALDVGPFTLRLGNDGDVKRVGAEFGVEDVRRAAPALQGGGCAFE